MSKKTMVQRANWRSEKFKHKSKRFYIKEYKGSPLEIELSIMNKGTFDMQDSDILRTISSLGLVLSSIDCAPVKVNALLLNNVFGDYDDVVNQLRKHHMEKVKWNILKIIGASNLLGNPINFVNALGTGV
jgi:vacuolar protein sorting-associated protein 13A/C